jgi:hypothetical protein
MKAIVRAVVVACFLALCSGGDAIAQSQAFENPKIKVVYDKPANPALHPVYTKLQNDKVLEQLKQFLAPLRLPATLTLQSSECGSSVRPYTHGGPVTVCYELIAGIENIVEQHTASNPELRRKLNKGAIVQALLHGIAAALFDIYEIPVWGRMEDASDRLSAFTMLQFGEDTAQTMMAGTANLFDWSNRSWSGQDFASPSSPEAQRFYNFVCIAYGFDEQSFKYVVDTGTLPLSRAGRCKSEYQQIRKAFYLRIMPFIDADLLVQVRAHEW